MKGYLKDSHILKYFANHECQHFQKVCLNTSSVCAPNDIKMKLVYTLYLKPAQQKYIYILVFSKYPIWWDQVGIDFTGRVPGYSRRWAIIGDSTKISTFTNLKHTPIMGSNHYFISRWPPFLHSKQYDTEEMLTKKRFLHIQTTVVAIKVESHDRFTGPISKAFTVARI